MSRERRLGIESGLVGDFVGDVFAGCFFEHVAGSIGLVVVSCCFLFLSCEGFGVGGDVLSSRLRHGSFVCSVQDYHRTGLLISMCIQPPN
jgi:hypothetical protein